MTQQHITGVSSPAAACTSRGDHYNTPLSLARYVWKFKGERRLRDPCHNAGSILRADVTYDGTSTREDGLLAGWGFGRYELAFANIPYSDSYPWCLKARAEAERGAEPLLLTKCDPSVGWWQAGVLPLATAIGYVRKRVSFLENGHPVKGNNFPSSFVYYGTGVARFCEVFDPIAHVEVLGRWR